MSSKGNILCRLINTELYKIFGITNRVIKGNTLAHSDCGKDRQFIVGSKWSIVINDRVYKHLQTFRLFSLLNGILDQMKNMNLVICINYITAKISLSRQYILTKYALLFFHSHSHVFITNWRLIVFQYTFIHCWHRCIYTMAGTIYVLQIKLFIAMSVVFGWSWDKQH